jgi:hypothetical protein
MSNETCETVKLNVELQENGIIRLSNGRLIARLNFETVGYDFNEIRSMKTAESDSQQAVIKALQKENEELKAERDEAYREIEEHDLAEVED